jgi:pimeloyl-ACP methyl ester carboxylesterase
MALNFPLRVWKGAKGKPILILIHGFGATEKSWTNPYEEFLGKGKISFDYVLADYRGRPSPPYFPFGKFRNYCFSTPLRRFSSRPPPLWDVLKDRGYNLITWTQCKPYGTIALAVEELNGIMEESEVIFGGGGPLILVGHSRGGLVARKWIQDHPAKRGRIDGLILLACPNGGSRLADVAAFAQRGKDLAPIVGFLRGNCRAIQGSGPGRAPAPFSLYIRPETQRARGAAEPYTLPQFGGDEHGFHEALPDLEA